jgi:hypothetical protein
MDTDTMLGKVVRTVWIFRSEGVHPAWIDRHTLPIVAFDSFLEFSDGALVRISPCEVGMGANSYPTLGLELQPCTLGALHFLSRSGRRVDATALEEASPFTPFAVAGIEASDPLGQGTTTQYSLTTGNGHRVTFRHIFPPLTLGIEVE